MKYLFVAIFIAGAHLGKTAPLSNEIIEGEAPIVYSSFIGPQMCFRICDLYFLLYCQSGASEQFTDLDYKEGIHK